MFPRSVRIASASGAESKGFVNLKGFPLLLLFWLTIALSSRAFFLPDIKLILVGPILFRQLFVRHCTAFSFWKKVTLFELLLVFLWRCISNLYRVYNYVQRPFSLSILFLRRCWFTGVRYSLDIGLK